MRGAQHALDLPTRSARAAEKMLMQLGGMMVYRSSSKIAHVGHSGIYLKDFTTTKLRERSYPVLMAVSIVIKIMVVVIDVLKDSF